MTFGGISGPYNADYYTCTLRNASVITNVTFVNGVQTLQANAIHDLEFVTDGVDGEIAWGSTSDDADHALSNYRSFFMSLHTLLDGLVTSAELRQPGPHLFTEQHVMKWETRLDQTVLGAASDFSKVNAAWKLGGAEADLVAQDKSLITLIEEISLNASWSLMSMPRFCKKVPALANSTLWVNKYTYEPQNLFIAYSCSIIASLVTVLTGVFALYTQTSSHDKHFSSISRTMQSPELTTLFIVRSPSNAKKIAATNIKLIEHREDGAEIFRIEGEKAPSGRT
ncbi:hypothetical protein BU24DRAFT_416675 [Aaosphaeria arxii CBS 175.79]|uniref:Uncharacterized protein n=1 Tax=Aaosphaeria arxii CBS 175.79 TaxID=1450172 RepID=A0A6A5Y6Z7_9PLEO|nr:uncharacterized protein BU24DRAFT_416675 [Aaosphaeria arxii CBS 175.79]KAF2020993.1 hypothetical protein BU24DRAFT_416675 [Aaosphaeria arxii CBS 175.79]